MKKVALAIFFCAGLLFSEESPVIEMYSGWCWAPFPYYYYPYPYLLYDPWAAPYYHRNPLYPYRYPEENCWTSYNDSPYFYYPYGGFCYTSRSVMIDLAPRKFFDLTDFRSLPAPPGSAPLTLRSKESVSIQDERIARFLSEQEETNSAAIPSGER